jgi:four helix bundle protein
MEKSQNPKRYDLEERTLDFAKQIIHLAKSLPKNTINFKLIDQCVRSGTSVGANYREANETETKKDFVFRIRISRKEAKETYYWLELIEESNPDFAERVRPLIRETNELIKIFAAIAAKSKIQ